MAQVTALTQANLLELARRITPEFYHATLENAANSGWEIHEGHAVAFARVSDAVANTQAGLYILQAWGAARATGAARFTRTSGVAGAVTIRAGTRLAAPGARYYVTQADVVFADAADLGPHDVAIFAERSGVGYNAPAGTVETITEYAAGSDEDATVAVTNTAALSGGRDATLDALGWDRGVIRRAGEGDESYRDRIRSLPDIVTPAAVQRLLDRYGVRWGLPFLWSEAIDLAESWDDGLAWDDPTELPLLDVVTHRGALAVLVPDVGEVYDAANAFDDGATWDDGAAYDDWDAAKAAIAAGLLDALDRITAAGIAVIVVQPSAPAQAPTYYDNYTDDLEG